MTYTYDAWGKLIYTTDSSEVNLGEKNPFRYKGYYYDTETQLYYLNSRYYNPEWGRFINADSVLGQTGGLLSHNLFAYCANNPVMMTDPSGHAPSFLEWLCDLWKRIQLANRNCYAYALGIGYKVSPGDVDKKSETNYSTYKKGDNIYAYYAGLISLVKSDVESIGGRHLNGIGDTIDSDTEYIIAMRINMGRNPTGLGAGAYHFIKLDRDGWSEKPGGGPTKKVRPLPDEFDPEGQWDPSWWDSKTIYFAVPYNHKE